VGRDGTTRQRALPRQPADVRPALAGYGRPGTLSRQQNADIVAYLLSFNQFPAGKTELAKDTDILKQIRFEAQKK